MILIYNYRFGRQLNIIVSYILLSKVIWNVAVK